MHDHSIIRSSNYPCISKQSTNRPSTSVDGQHHYQLFRLTLFAYHQSSGKMAGIIINGVRDDESVKLFDDLNSPTKDLIRAAIEARKNAYCPYSNFAVGAAIQTEDGQIYTGSNIDNGAYSASLCAERVAAAKAISDGKRVFIAAAVVGLQPDRFTTPCGVCRQFLMEFAKKDFPIYITKPINEPLRVLCTSLFQLLPYGFAFEK